MDEKEKSSSNIEEEIETKIKAQQVSILEQVEAYKENITIKLGEEKELIKMLNDYKIKFDDFNNAMKKSRKTYKRYEEEIRN